MSSGDSVVAAVRPDDVRLGPPDPPQNPLFDNQKSTTENEQSLPARVEVVEYQGRELAVEARTPDGIGIFLRTQQRLAPGDAVTLRIDPDRLLVFPGADFAPDDATLLRADG